jgi:Uma2 family endonuclease
MADNTKQYRYIQTIAGGLQAMFRHDPDVFVAGDFLWYPVEGHPEICQAPDAMVVFGRPKGDRGSYAQFIEGRIPPQVVFEVLSPKNTAPEMARKRDFYERYGVEEYYEYDPQRGRLRGWQRDEAGALAPIAEMQGRVSPRLGIRFDLQPDGELRLIMPDGRPFLTVEELADERDATAQRLEQEQQRAEEAHRQAEAAHRQAEQERLRAERLAARLRALGIEPDGES